MACMGIFWLAENAACPPHGNDFCWHSVLTVSSLNAYKQVGLLSSSSSGVLLFVRSVGSDAHILVKH